MCSMVVTCRTEWVHIKPPSSFWSRSSNIEDLSDSAPVTGRRKQFREDSKIRPHLADAWPAAPSCCRGGGDGRKIHRGAPDVCIQGAAHHWRNWLKFTISKTSTWRQLNEELYYDDANNPLVIKLKRLHIKLVYCGEHIRRSLSKIIALKIMVIILMTMIKKERVASSSLALMAWLCYWCQLSAGVLIIITTITITIITILMGIMTITNLHNNLPVLGHGKRWAVGNKHRLVPGAEGEVRVEVALYQDHLVIIVIIIGDAQCAWWVWRCQ